jgi:hypothetical protein
MALGKHDGGKVFWNWFEANFYRLRAVKSGQEPVLGELGEELERVHTGLVWEFGRGIDREFEFTVSADGMLPLIPEVQALVACAPTIPECKISAFRQRQPGFALQMHGRRVDAKSVYYLSRRAGDQLDLLVYADQLTTDNHRELFGICCLLIDAEVGEFDAMTRIRALNLVPLSDAKGNQKPISELVHEIDSLKGHNQST